MSVMNTAQVQHVLCIQQPKLNTSFCMFLACAAAHLAHHVKT